MSTKMTGEDWAVALEVFQASLPRRGDKGCNNWLFLEAIRHCAQHLGDKWHLDEHVILIKGEHYILW